MSDFDASSCDSEQRSGKQGQEQEDAASDEDEMMRKMRRKRGHDEHEDDEDRRQVLAAAVVGDVEQRMRTSAATGRPVDPAAVLEPA